MISVLLVDDEPDLLEVAKLHLEKSGPFTVDTCNSAHRALRTIQKKHYDAIIADYNMPEMTGLDLLKELKAQGNSTPFILLTASTPEDVVIDALNHGATYYLRKNHDPDAPFADLSRKLHLAVHRHQSGHSMQIFTDISRHDLLNKVSALTGYVDLVRARTDDRVILGYMTKQHTLLSTLREQIEFLTDYEKLGIRRPFWQPLSPVIRRAVSLANLGSVTVNLPAAGDYEIYADPLLMKVFYNLLENSVRHGGHVSTVNISCSIAGDHLHLLYEDDGTGIPLEEKERVFERGTGKNTGLGLFLIREVLAMTGITIHECGVPGRGVRFEIIVPRDAFRSPVIGNEPSFVSRS
ncbi:MAG: hybrid sensor histidine kinase/response regulator [Methanomicrobiales archaeon]|nr:hybrid sensor histidine kinase/response regulator [Methanomicrobiales archaeon]